MDYFDELAKNYTFFKNNGHKFSQEDRENDELQVFAKIAKNALGIHRKALSNCPNFQQYNPQIQKTKRQEYLQKVRADLEQGIANFFEPILKKAQIGREGLKNAGRPRQPETPTEIALQREIRDRLRALPTPEWTQILQDETKRGNLRIFESVMNDPLPVNFLSETGEAEVVAEARENYIKQKFPEAWENAIKTARTLEVAELIKVAALTSSIKENEIQAGI